MKTTNLQGQLGRIYESQRAQSEDGKERKDEFKFNSLLCVLCVLRRSLSLRTLRLITFCYLLFVFISCPNSFRDGMDLPPPPAGYGYFVMGEAVVSRTILPQTELEDFDGFTLEFVYLDEADVDDVIEERAYAERNDPVTLRVGTWNLTVSAFMNVGDALPAAMSEIIEIVIAEGATTTLDDTILLNAISEGTGSGSFIWDIEYQTGVTATITITPMAGGDPIAVINNAEKKDERLDIPVGQYQVVFTLTLADHKTVNLPQVMRVYQNMTSRFPDTGAFDFSDYFIYDFYDILFESNGGTLFTAVPVVFDKSFTEMGFNIDNYIPTRDNFFFDGWYTEPAFTTQFNPDTKINKDTTLYAKWGTVSVNNVTTTTIFDNLAAALTSITTTGTYTVTIASNQELAPTPLTVNNTNITLVAANPASPVTVQLSENGSLLTVESGVTLSLGNGVVLRGRNATEHGANNNTWLVKVNDGGTLNMNNGSVITGNTTSSPANGVGVLVHGNNASFIMEGGRISGNHVIVSVGGFGGGVMVANGGSFTMKGGEISGNTITATADPNSVLGGGVSLLGSGSSFTMDGGEISGNESTGTGGGVFIQDGGFTMNGGEISGNIAASGGGVMITGTDTSFTMSGNAFIHENNDVRLSSPSTITIDPELSPSDPPIRAVITPTAYNVGTQILHEDSVNLVAAAERFAITPDGDNVYYIDSDGKLARPVITITTQPTDSTVTFNSISGSLSVVASVDGGSSITGYQWYRNTDNNNTSGTLIDGATSASYLIPTNLNAGTHYFYVVVSADRGAVPVTSNVATVTVKVNAGFNITYEKMKDGAPNLDTGVILSRAVKASREFSVDANDFPNVIWYLDNEPYTTHSIRVTLDPADTEFYNVNYNRIGKHFLTVFAEDTNGTWHSKTVWFEVVGVAVTTVDGSGTATDPFIMQGNFINVLDYINNSAKPGVYELVLDENIELGAQRLSGGGTHLILRGSKPVEIQAEAVPVTLNSKDAHLFNIEGGASLTIGENITLKGIDNNANGTLVTIHNGSFTMEDGSKITGHSASSLDGVVFVGPGNVNDPARIFTMNGGEISGNHNSTTNPQGYTISAITVHNGGQFIMTGGRIAGNTNNFPGDSPLSVGDNLGKADVRIFETGVFTISGSAFIDALFLHSTTTTRASINVGGPWTGRIGSLSIRTSVDTFAQAMSTYEDQQIITLNDDVSFTLQELREKFPIGEFRANAAPYYQLISDTHNLNEVGGGFGLREN